MYEIEKEKWKETLEVKELKKPIRNYRIYLQPEQVYDDYFHHGIWGKDEALEGIIFFANQEERSKQNESTLEELVKNLVEVNISTLGNHENFELSEIEEVMSAEDFLTYQEKYLGNGKKGGTITSVKGSKNARSSHKIPASIDDKLKEEVRHVASMAVRALNSSGVARFDFLIDKKAKKVYINEVNSIPGSLAFYLWDPLNKDYTELLDDMINQGIKDYKRRISKIHSFETNILEGYHGGMKGLKGVKGLKGKLK